jgi:hypothetical protein
MDLGVSMVGGCRHAGRKVRQLQSHAVALCMFALRRYREQAFG